MSCPFPVNMKAIQRVRLCLWAKAVLLGLALTTSLRPTPASTHSQAHPSASIWFILILLLAGDRFPSTFL